MGITSQGMTRGAATKSPHPGKINGHKARSVREYQLARSAFSGRRGPMQLSRSDQTRRPVGARRSKRDAFLGIRPARLARLH